MEVQQLSDDDLERFIAGLINSQKLLNAKIVEFLLELERRKLYCKSRHQSLYDYLTKQLAVAREEAYSYSRALRLIIRFPQLLSSLKEKQITISTLKNLERYFSYQKIINQQEQLTIINAALQTPERAFERELQRFEAPPMDLIKPTNNGKSRAHLTLEKQTVEKLQRLKNLLYQRGRGNFDQILSFTLDSTLEQVDRLQQQNSRPYTDGTHSRSISEGLKTAVWQRAKGKCEICSSEFCLEIDHVIPYARGGTNDLWNLRLLCHNCNERARRQVFENNKSTLINF